MDLVMGQQNFLLLQEALNEHGLANNCSVKSAQLALMKNITSLVDPTESISSNISNSINSIVSSSSSSNSSSHLPPCDISFVADPNLVGPFKFGGNETPLINGTYAVVDQYDTSRYYILQPHDMLHPSKINPAFLPIIITHTITFLVGLIGNCVVITTWSMHGKFRSPTAVFLVSLAVADLLLILVLVPLETLEYFMFTWGGLSSICKTIAYVEGISAFSTVLNLVAVSIERFLVIVYPMRARSWCTMSSTRKGLVIIWGLALILSTPVLLTRHSSPLTYYNETTSVTLYYCFDVENNLTFIVAIYQLFMMFIVPALFMLVCYYVVIRQLWLSTQTVNSMTRADNRRLPRNHSVTSMISNNNRTTGGGVAVLSGNSNNNNIPAKRNEAIELTQNHKLGGSAATAASASDHNNNFRQSAWSWLRYLNIVYLWHQWRFNKELNDLLSNGAIAQQHNTNAKHNGGTLQVQNEKADDDDGSVRRQSGDSEEGEEGERSCTWRNLCCWPICEHTLSGGRHAGEEVSECTMSSTYQMTSCTADRRHDQQCNSSERQSPVDVIEEGLLHHHQQQQQNVCSVNDGGKNEALRGRTADNRAVAQQSKPLPNNVMEITKSRFQVIKMLVLIILLFLLCWGPRLILNVLIKLGLPMYSHWIYNTRIVFHVLSFVHSAVNPFVYGLMSSNFRAMVCSVFQRRSARSRSAAQQNAQRQQQQQNQQRQHQQGRRNLATRAPEPSRMWCQGVEPIAVKHAVSALLSVSIIFQLQTS